MANLYGATDGIGPVVVFAREAAELSDGKIRINFANNWGRDDDPSEETSLLRDIASGGADLAWVGTRAFGKLGVRSLDPLQAPFLITSYQAQAVVCRSEVTQDALASLTAAELHGIAVLAGELRKPFGITRPLVAALDYEGATIRTHASVVGEETLRVLGAMPVLRSKLQMGHQEPSFDGMDNHCSAIAAWGYSGTLTTNVNLWPRTLALVASLRRWRELGAETQHVLTEAGRRAAAVAAAALAKQERLDRQVLQGTAVKCATASPDQLSDLRERVRPVYDSLRREPTAAVLLERLEQMVAPFARAQAS